MSNFTFIIRVLELVVLAIFVALVVKAWKER